MGIFPRQQYRADCQGISCIYAVVFSALHFSLLCHGDSIGFGTAIQRSPGAAVSFLLAIAVLPGVIFLLLYHVRVSLDPTDIVHLIRLEIDYMYTL